MKDDILGLYRNFLKDLIRQDIDFSKTDQSLGIMPPPIEKPADPKGKIISLPESKEFPIKQHDITRLISQRLSHRHFLDKPLTIDELGFLLWATQGIRRSTRSSAFRTVPSAGCRHSFETYLAISNINSLEPGIYRYLPIEHKLNFEKKRAGLENRLTTASLGQSFVGRAPVTFIWTVIPYRMEWRYGLAAHKVILIDVGHVCQNLYLAAGAIGSGTCAVAAYDQELMDELVAVDGEEEYTIYLAPVGKIDHIK